MMRVDIFKKMGLTEISEEKRLGNMKSTGVETDNIGIGEKSKGVTDIAEVRYTVRVPVELSIQIDMAIDRLDIKRNKWILQAIQEKLDSETPQKNEVE